MNSITFLLLVGVITVALGCKCKEQTVQEAYCAAHWVSQLKVAVKVSKQPDPSGQRAGLNNIKYVVSHSNVFKKPSNVTQLATEIYTPSESPACGLKISSGKEYLLAGRVENGNTLFTVLCGQLIADSTTADSYEKLLEWSNVPSSTKEALKTIKC